MDVQQQEFQNADNLRPMNQESDSQALIRNEYTVEERDTIADIEKKHGLSWNEIRDANQDILGNERELQPGLKLKIPRKQDQ